MIKIIVAKTSLQRLKGLLFYNNLDSKTVMILENCKCVHSIGMQFDIKVIYLTSKFEVLDIQVLKKNSIGKFVRHTAHIIETSLAFNILNLEDVIKKWRNMNGT